MVSSFYASSMCLSSHNHSSLCATIMIVALAILAFGCCGFSDKSSVEKHNQIRYTVHQVSFNEHFSHGLYENIPLENPIQVFGYVFSNLESHVKVLPTENYYYFNFTARGRYIWGNFRLSPNDRDQGILHFAYFDYENPTWYRYLRLTSTEGVLVKRVADLVYSVEFNGKLVVFQLNDLPQILPKELGLLDGEVFIGQSFDESGFYFSLVYSKDFNNFLWILNELGIDWNFVNLGSNLLLHPLSSFIFFDDLDKNRKVLVGVYAWNVQSNNYFDGPFDQIPDNFIHTTEFRKYLTKAYPEVKELINERGEYFNKDERVSVMPYLIYGSIDDVKLHLRRCKNMHIEIRSFYQCLARDKKLEHSKSFNKKRT